MDLPDCDVVVHDEFLETTHPGIFVAGDAAGPPGVLHTASLEGRAAGRNAARRKDFERPELLPALSVVFTDPMAASVGLDAQLARDRGHDVAVAFSRGSTKAALESNANVTGARRSSWTARAASFWVVESLAITNVGSVDVARLQ